jgi:hypothetical protein
MQRVVEQRTLLEISQVDSSSGVLVTTPLMTVFLVSKCRLCLQELPDASSPLLEFGGPVADGGGGAGAAQGPAHHRWNHWNPVGNYKTKIGTGPRLDRRRHALSVVFISIPPTLFRVGTTVKLQDSHSQPFGYSTRVISWQHYMYRKHIPMFSHHRYRFDRVILYFLVYKHPTLSSWIN